MNKIEVINKVHQQLIRTENSETEEIEQLMKITEGKQLAHLLFYSERGIRTFKNRTAKKLGTNSIELRKFLIHLSINDVPSKTDSAFVYGTKQDSN